MTSWKYHLLPPGGLLEFGREHIIFRDKRVETQKFFLLTGGTQKVFLLTGGNRRFLSRNL